MCPACRQVLRHEGYGEVSVLAPLGEASLNAVRRRVQNVAARACFTQPERRLVAVEREGDCLRVYTTSQKLAHRIARELQKAFGGRVAYSWSDREGRLLARWRSGERC